ncbi:hypothetical protein TSAR_013819 [Trichomalopsis sarcophagae]|uniref:Peptidase M12B domain-containing protein n=1 Tax=Trichomalopsis sarcophagae TaxID=543379 RepID=A0A232FAM0_9HYME|nr:hypothetical protein TSAR_013819 [Trichomalopsis sarcophagae]
MLNLARTYFSGEFEKATHFYNYDSSITMSKYFTDTSMISFTNILFLRFSLETVISAGAAYRSEICSKDLNVGYFSGLLSGTHELGHLLSLSHDFKKGNGCEGYIDNVNTVMAPFVQDVKEFVWSDCSKTRLQEFAW